MKVLIYSVIILLFASCGPERSKSPIDQQTNSETTVESVSVDFCELVDKAETYNGKRVETRAILLAGFESAFLYDPKCVTDERLVWFVISEAGAEKKLSEYLTPDTTEFRAVGLNRVKGKFIGVFRTPNGKGFGHLNTSNYQFEIADVYELQRVPDSIPYPWPKPKP